MKKVIEECLGGGLPASLLEDWRRLYRLRNAVSHTERLEQEDFLSIRSTLHSSDFLPAFLKIKQSPSGARHPRG